MDAHHPELFDAEYVINEGPAATECSASSPVFSCSVGEASLAATRRACTPPGSCLGDNCLERLVRASMDREAAHPPPEVATMSSACGRGHPRPRVSEQGLARVAEENPFLRALLTDTVSANMFNSGVKSNVIPSVAEATLDCRLLPGHDPAAFIEQVRQVIDDPRVEVEQVMESHTPISPVGTSYLSRRRREPRGRARSDRGPSIATGFTDSRVFRKRGITAYGVALCLLDGAEIATVHGNDERIPIEKLSMGLRMLYEIVRRMCA
jgi:acetylornithine deacetylase/succinyl-diaminopimelate desuccinylase-like protein